MQKKIICSTSMDNVGCTFLDWSILFLSGKDYFFNSEVNGLEMLSSNPITAINAHGHKKNHPSGFKLTQQCVETFLKSPFEMLTLYPFLMYHEVASQELNISEDHLNDPAINQKVIDYQFEDFSKLFDYLLDQEASVIYVDHNLPIYNLESPRSFEKMFREPTSITSAADFKNKFQNVYFSKSIHQWQNLGLTTVWDTRERMALDTRPFHRAGKPKLNLSRPHYFIDSQEWITNGAPTIKKILDFCKLIIDDSRWDHWMAVYNKWQSIHHQRLNFCHQLPHIVDSIVNNWYYEIDLTFDQEVVVQHCLIYHHNLNLKTWQLEKFPNNTQDLHKLLEDNIHPLGDV